MTTVLPHYMQADLPAYATHVTSSDKMHELFCALDSGHRPAIKEALGAWWPVSIVDKPASTLSNWKRIAETNILDLPQLYRNIRHPIVEWAHTGHMQYSIDWYQFVNHYLGERLVCVDLVAPNMLNGDYNGKAGNHYNRYTRFERIDMGDEQGKKRLDGLVQAIVLHGDFNKASP